MGSNPINLAIRFILELTALYGLGQWGWHQGNSTFTQILFAALAVIMAGAVWGTFAVPDDPSRSGKAPVPVPGIVRLLIELAFFAIGAWAFYATGNSQTGLIIGIVTLVHYIISYDRVLWLLKQK